MLLNIYDAKGHKGRIDVDFDRGVLIAGDEKLWQTLVQQFEYAKQYDEGIVSLHSQAPAYVLDKPFTDQSQFVALLDSVGWHAKELDGVPFPPSTWDDDYGELPPGGVY